MVRYTLARWLQALALRLDPRDPFEGVDRTSLHRAIGNRWIVMVEFPEYSRARDFNSFVLVEKIDGKVYQ